ncbi:hemerythrin domain-containing protein [Nocardia yunnanensis]|uniref:Hemerythrin domain-containing protein n=1 Tax=Nocardia yunnanensis TaxID=2382165 RepID=A0A386ZC46_9NOCA|nr:hemerythrin domain-containing protein [Nocardia yunnanensis]AYF75180.1 hemerythrin domain-containing protein [Nocardia yunnanensis]
MSIDFTLMYLTHDAFRRDLDRLTAAVAAGRAASPGVRAGWANFTRQLHVHHTVEDSALWPPVLARLADRPADVTLMADMEAEHAALDPALHAVDEALRTASPDLAIHVHALTGLLTDHMLHEETKALPLIDEVLTPEDWSAFRTAMARTQGPSGAAVYVPWVLDAATPERRRQFLAAMPAPIRPINALLWERRYHRRRLWSH